ncbi:MAG: hypothetical protein P1V20_18245 [Verrucomicrobiales bacterium]|nr:hypothetical protein [Verrucomicrobiales bacterium]
MKKLILILSMICMLGAIAIGVMNKKFLADTTRALAQTKDSVRSVTQDLGVQEDERDGLKESESQARDRKNQASAAVDEVQQSLKLVQRKVDDQKEKLEGIEIEQREIDMAVKRVFPDGQFQSPDDLRMILNMLQDTLTSNQNAVNSLDMELQKLLAQRQVEMGKVGEEESYQLDRRTKIVLANLEATVIAVNNDWGFVMVNAGRVHGVEPNASLLVKRGNVRVARLRILNLQDNVCVCDVVKGSVNRGVTVDAGDRVIFEDTF